MLAVQGAASVLVGTYYAGLLGLASPDLAVVSYSLVGLLVLPWAAAGALGSSGSVGSIILDTDAFIDSAVADARLETPSSQRGFAPPWAPLRRSTARRKGGAHVASAAAGI